MRRHLKTRFSSLGLPATPEELYRPRYLKADIQMASISISVFLAVTGLFIFRDYQFLGFSAGFFALGALRLGFIGIGFLLVHFIQKVTDFRVFDRVLFIALFAGITCLLIINATRPADYITYLLVDLASVSAMYLAVPFKLSSQVTLGLFISIGDIVLILLTKDASLRPQLYTIIPAFALVNVVGFGLSRRLYAARSREALATESAARAITDKERLEREQRRNDQLEAVGRAAGGVTQDFDTIFNTILGKITLAKAVAAPGTEMDQILAEAETASIQGKELTHRMIDFARGVEPVKQPTYIADLVRETVKTALADTRIESRVKIAEVLMAELDPHQVRQALTNLLDNSREAMPEGGTVWVTAENVDRHELEYRGLNNILPGDHYYIRVTVTDNGPGIPAQVREKAFQLFFTTKPGASGLGLGVAYSIVKSHGGYITLEPETGKGAAFSIYLPAGISAQPHKEVPAKPFRRPNILVIEGEHEAKKATGRMLHKLGYDCEMADDGPEAVKIFRDFVKSNHQFAAVMFDLDDRDGAAPEALKLLRELNPAIKVVAAGHIADDASAQRFKDLGYAGVVNKPYTLEQLREALAQALEPST